MPYRKQSTSDTESHALPGQSAVTYDAHKATLTLYDSSGDLEVTADGVDNMLELFQGSSAISDLTGMTIPAEPEQGTVAHDEWSAQWAGLDVVPANGAKMVVRVRIELECYEEQV